MGWVTQEQIERAREIPAIDYILRHESGNIKRVGKEYRLLDHTSLAVGERGWYWHSQGIGGWSALSFLTQVRGYGFVDAVCALLNEKPVNRAKTENAITDGEPSPRNGKPKPERPPFSLPIRNSDNKRIIAYLQSRGIDRELIVGCIKRGDLYESRYYHNCVFLGKDENRKTRYATMRSTNTNYMLDADGSSKKHGFILPPSDPQTHEIAVYESPVDALSHQTLCKQGFLPAFGGWRLSLGGTSALALEHFLSQHGGVTHCVICTDDDKAGDISALKIAALPGITAERALPAAGCKDWNDALQLLQKAERTKHKSLRGNTPQLYEERG